MNIAILGYDVEGRASYDYFAAQGHNLTILDQKTDLEIPQGVESVLGDNYLDDLDRFDLIVRTAGLHPQKILDKNPGIEEKVTTQINEFLKACPTRNIIGVTGTKGKGTTSTLIAQMLEAAGKTVVLGGNIGVPPLSFIEELTEESWVVLELSSFQLIDMKASPHIGVCLMVVPEHLDWHPDTDEYYAAKSNLFAHQNEDDVAVYFSENETSKQIVSSGEAQKIPYFSPPGAHVADGVISIDDKPICQTDELKLLGAHNWQNACAAITAVWQITQDTEAIRSVLTSFSGLPFRLELVQKVDGVSYYNDSFGTTPETAIVAIQAFTAPKIVILGGRAKGIPFDNLARVVTENNVKHVIAIGEAGEEISEELRRVGYENIVKGGETMDEIVRQAHELASAGDVVLLSTGCASFDMFQNYKDRGEKFIAAVQALASAAQ